MVFWITESNGQLGVGRERGGRSVPADFKQDGGRGLRMRMEPL